MSSTADLFTVSNIKENASQLKEPKAFLKALEIFFSMVAFACIVDFRVQVLNVTVGYPSSYGSSGPPIFFAFIGTVCWIFSIVMLGVYLVMGRDLPDPLTLFDFGASCAWTGCWFLASTILAAAIGDLFNNPNAVNRGNLIAGVGFGYICSILYAANCWFCFKETQFFSSNRDTEPRHVQAARRPTGPPVVPAN